MPHGKPSKKAALWSTFSSRKRQEMRLALIERDGANCFHCGRPTRPPNGTNDPDQMTVDHWPVPKRQLPKSEWLDPSRAVLSCLGCNRRIDNESQTQDRKRAAA